MNAVLVADHEPQSPEWHAVRATGLGGSDIAAILGLSPWESPFSLWHRKRGAIGDVTETPVMTWGKRLEDAICLAFADEHPDLGVTRTGTWRNTERPWQLANPDRLVTGGILEAKTAGDAHGWGEPGSPQIPIYYTCQVLWYLDTLGLDTAHVAVLIAGRDYREYAVRYDQVEAQFLRDRAAAFWQSIQEDRPPALDGHTATYQVVRELHPDIEPVDVEIPGDLADRYRAACAAHKAAEAAKNEACAEVLAALGTARNAVHGGDRIAYRVPGRDGNPPYLRAATTKATPNTSIKGAAA